MNSREVSARSTVKEEALAALVKYLVSLDCAEEVISSFKLQHYSVMKDPKFCQIDAVCLENLELLANSDDSSRRGSLLGLLETCRFHHGKRMLRRWICHPLRRIDEIEQRLDAVELLSACPSACDTFFEVIFTRGGGLAKIGDVERVFSRLTSGTAPLDVFLQFFKTCEAFTSAAKAFYDALEQEKLISAESVLLFEILQSFPNLVELVVEDLPFDRAQAAANSKIQLYPGKDPEMEVALAEKRAAEAELAAELKRIQKEDGFSSAAYAHSKTERYVLTLSIKQSEKSNIPEDWKSVKKLKDVVKYNVPSVQERLQNLLLVERRIQSMEDNLLRNLQTSLAKTHRAPCLDAISRIAQLDCFISLASFVRTAGGEGLCRPRFVSRDETPTLIVQGMWHPYVRPSGESFIKNDLTLGGYNDSVRPPILLVTGPNMGGKCASEAFS